jgi:FkbM family methyltransferase
MSSILSRLFDFVPANSPLLYKFCSRYVDRFRGENNDNILTNGESWLIEKVIRQCRVVFDVGANQGMFTKLVLDINPNAHVHCFEPSEYTFQLLASNAFPSNVVCNNLALGSRREEGILYVYEDGGGLNSLHNRFLDHLHIAPKAREKILLETVETYCTTRQIREIDFMKVDTEGFEFQVMLGAKRMLQEGNIKRMLFEYGGCYIDARVMLKNVFEFFKPLDYDLYKLHPRKLVLHKTYDPRHENFHYANWVAIHRKCPAPTP